MNLFLAHARSMSWARLVASLVVAFAAAITRAAAAAPPADAPAAAPAADRPVDFARDVAPIFQAHCVRCHHPAHKSGDLSPAKQQVEFLRSREAAARQGQALEPTRAPVVREQLGRIEAAVARNLPLLKQLASRAGPTS